MKLSLHTIEHELGAAVAGSSIASDACEPALEYPALFNASEHRLFEHIAYVASSDDIDASKEKIRRQLSRNPHLTLAFICLGEPPAFCLEAKNCDVLWVDDRQNESKAFNAVQEAFQRFNAWERELGMIVEQGGELPGLVNESLKVFKNDICITDPFSRVLAHRVFRNVRFPREQTDLIKEGAYLPKGMLFDGVRDEQDGENFTSPLPTFSTMQAFDCTVLRSTIGLSPEYAIVLSIHPNFQPVGKKDCAPALTLASAIERLYRASSATGGSRPFINAHSSLKSLILGRQVSDADLVQSAIAQGWSQDADEYQCLCIDFASSLQVQDCCFMRPYAAVCSRLQATFDCVAFVVENRIVAALNRSRMGMEDDRLANDLGRFAEDHHLIIGSSAPYLGLRSLRDSYRQAFAALRMGYVGGSEELVPFPAHALEIGMNFIMKEMAPERFCPKELLELAQQDHDLFVALKTYLLSNCNSSEAGKRLSLQRNSFVYRLEKARRLLGLDLDDPDTRLLLLISFKLIDLYGLSNIEPLAQPRS